MRRPARRLIGGAVSTFGLWVWAGVAGAQDAYKPADPSVQALSGSSTSPAPPTSAAAPASSYLQRQGLQCGDFHRGADGSWSVVQAIALPAPAGPLRLDTGASFRPGQMVGGYDLGAMLQRDCPGG